MKNLLNLLILLSLVISVGSCKRIREVACAPSENIPEGPWNFNLPHGPWDRACQGVVDNEEMTRVVLTYAAELKKKYKLKFHDGRMYYADDIYKLRLDFTTQQILELCPARHLLVDIVEGYLSRINENAILKGQISNRPFTAMNLEVHVTFTSFYIRFVDPMYIQWIILEDGTSYFFNAELGERTSDYWHKRIEPYNKTLQIVNIEDEIGPEDQDDLLTAPIGKYFESIEL